MQHNNRYNRLLLQSDRSHAEIYNWEGYCDDAMGADSSHEILDLALSLAADSFHK